VTQFYDQFLAAAGLRTTQFSILARLQRLGPMTISALAADLVMDRTTLGRNLQPLERQRLVAVVKGRTDRRSREIRLTDTGAERLRTAVEGWVKAQASRKRAKSGCANSAKSKSRNPPSSPPSRWATVEARPGEVEPPLA
jgi:DNA-binding MarR family transcriptional regulator